MSATATRPTLIVLIIHVLVASLLTLVAAITGFLMSLPYTATPTVWHWLGLGVIGGLAVWRWYHAVRYGRLVFSSH